MLDLCHLSLDPGCEHRCPCPLGPLPTLQAPSEGGALLLPLRTQEPPPRPAPGLRAGAASRGPGPLPGADVRG